MRNMKVTDRDKHECIRYTKHAGKTCWGKYTSSVGRRGYEGPGSSSTVRSNNSAHSPLAHKQANTLTKCQQLCSTDPKCQAINFNGSLCYTYMGQYNGKRLTNANKSLTGIHADPQQGICTAQSSKGRSTGYNLYIKTTDCEEHKGTIDYSSYVRSSGKKNLTIKKCDDERLEIQFHRCPLKDTWVEQGRNEEDLELLCKAAGAIDGGLFTRAGFTFKGETWTKGKSGCCLLKVEPGASIG